MFEPFADSELRRRVWASYHPDFRRSIEEQIAALPSHPYSVGLGAGILPSGLPLTVLETRAPELPQSLPEAKATVYGQYHFLKALAARLDGRIGSEQERQMFEAGLLEYLENRVRFNALRRDGRKALPAAR